MVETINGQMLWSSAVTKVTSPLVVTLGSTKGINEMNPNKGTNRLAGQGDS